MENLTDELIMRKISLYMRVVKFRRTKEKEFFDDGTAVRAYKNLRKLLTPEFDYLSEKEKYFVINQFKDDFEYFRNHQQIENFI